MQNTWLENRLKKYVDEKTAGGGLPEVTDVDDGKVLGVDDGEWKAVEPSGGLEAFIVHSNDGVLDKTWQEIYDALNAGKICYIEEKDLLLSGRTYIAAAVDDNDGNWVIYPVGAQDQWTASSATGYPVYSD